MGFRDNWNRKAQNISREKPWFPVEIFPRKPIHWNKKIMGKSFTIAKPPGLHQVDPSTLRSSRAVQTTTTSSSHPPDPRGKSGWWLSPGKIWLSQLSWDYLFPKIYGKVGIILPKDFLEKYEYETCKKKRKHQHSFPTFLCEVPNHQPGWIRMG